MNFSNHHQHQSKSSLFIGDLAIFCTEDDIFRAFSPFGEITEVKIIKSEETSRNLSYGFISFASVESAADALNYLNGQLLCGRPMRINWASYKIKGYGGQQHLSTSSAHSPTHIHSPTNLVNAFSNNNHINHHNNNNHNNNNINSNHNNSNNSGAVLRNAKGEEIETSAVHVSFISYQTSRLVTEESLRSLYSKYGKVLDVSIKKSMIDRDIGRQSGYGFVHYELSKEGVVSAVAAAKELTDTTIDDVNYKSSISHNLKKFIHSELDTTSTTAPAQMMSAPKPMPTHGGMVGGSNYLYNQASSNAGNGNVPVMAPTGDKGGSSTGFMTVPGTVVASIPSTGVPAPYMHMYSNANSAAAAATVHHALPAQPLPSYHSLPTHVQIPSPVTSYMPLPPGVFLTANSISSVPNSAAVQNLSPTVYYATTLANLAPMTAPAPSIAPSGPPPNAGAVSMPMPMPMPMGALMPSPQPSPSSPSRTLSQDSYREEFNRFMVSSLVSPMTYYTRSPAASLNSSSPLVVQTAPLFPTVMLSADGSFPSGNSHLSPQQQQQLQRQLPPQMQQVTAEQMLQHAGLSTARHIQAQVAYQQQLHSGNSNNAAQGVACGTQQDAVHQTRVSSQPLAAAHNSTSHPSGIPQSTARARSSLLRRDLTTIAATTYNSPGYPSPMDAFRNGNKEELIYVTAIVADESRPDYLATIDVNESSPTFGQVIHRLSMPFVGDELHHSGWNACSSCFGNSEAQRKFLILPGVKSGRIYAIDVRNPRAPVHHKYVDGETIAKATSLAYPHTSHCLGDGTIMVSMMGYAKDGTSTGDFLLLSSEMDILGTYSRSKEIPFGYDFWYQPHFNTMISTEFGTPSSFMAGFNPAEATSHYGHHIHVWNFKERTLRHSLDLGIDGLIPLEVRFAHDPTKPWAYVGAALSSNIIYLEIDPESKEVSHSVAVKQSWADVSGWALPQMPPLITDILLSLDDKYLIFSNWLRGDVALYDISADPKHPVFKDRVFVGGLFLSDNANRVSEVAEASLAEVGLFERPARLVIQGVPIQGGPQMLQLSLDGQRLYVTNSLLSPWDTQFYGTQFSKERGSQLIRLLIDREEGKLTIDEGFVVDFGKEPDGPALAHECRFPGGDCSSDIWLTCGSTW